MESLALLVVAAAIIYHGWKGQRLMADFTRLNAAIAALAVPLAAIADRLNSLSVDEEDQSQVDEDAEQLENIASQLQGLADGGAADHVGESLGGETVGGDVNTADANTTVGDLVTQAPSEDQPGDVDHVPADVAPTATTGNPDLPEADDTAGQVSDDEPEAA